MSNPLFDRLFASGRPDAVAIETEGAALTYGQLLEQTGRWANALKASGVRPGERVAAQVEKSAANLILYLAVLRSGAVFLPLNPAYTNAELSYFLSDAEPALMVCDPQSKAQVAEVAGPARVATLDREGEGSLADLARRQALDFPIVAREESDLAAICYTSGTTGRSKGALLTQRALLSNAATLAGLWRFTTDDVLIHALPLFHVHGLFIASHVALMAGARSLLQRNFAPAAVIAALPRATALMGVPTFYTRLLADPGLTAEAAAGMRLFVSGSAPLLAATHQAWEARTGHRILERYGLTETGMNTSNPYDGERIAGTVGLALPGVEVRTAGGEAIGEVEVRGPNVCAGYWRDPAKSAAAFTADGWFRTGDLGSLDARGYLTIVGREKDLIISGGLNVYPGEVEAVLDALPGVAESAVIGLPHSDLGEAVTAVIVRADDAAPDEAAILAGAAPSLARFKQPRRVLFAERLPRNAMGKVSKAILRQTHADLYTDGASLEPARAATT